jgi:exopolyphosphatase/guanosine-5'-triphosphate,3'-diphosphate pyrophosphatase
MENPPHPSKIVAFIDIGTNSVRLLVVRLNPNYSYTIISQEKEIIRLGENEFQEQSASLHPEAMKRAILVCKKFVELSKTYGAEEIIAVATSAVREASNKNEFLDLLEKEAGLIVKIISGREEARLVYLGISSGVDIGNSRALFFDLGGGSLEIIIGTQSKIEYIESLKLGAIRLTELYLQEGRIAPVPKKVYGLMQQHVRENLLWASHKSKILKVGIAFGTSGTFTNLAEISNKMFKTSEKIKGLTLERGRLKTVAETLYSLPLDQRKRVSGINPDRADIIVAGAAVIESLMQEFDLKEIKVSSRGLRDGMLVDYLSKIKGFPLTHDIPIRERSVIQLGRSCNFDEKHSKIVSDLSLQLFDSAKRLGIHNFGQAERELMRYASLLHDIGDFISFNDHQIHSYYIISHAELLGFDQNEVAVIANIARFHRKKFPDSKALKNEELDPYSQEVVKTLSTLLRIAENLDRSHCGHIQKAEFTQANSKLITISVWSNADCRFEEWRLTENIDALEQFYGAKLAINWEKPNSL